MIATVLQTVPLDGLALGQIRTIVSIIGASAGFVTAVIAAAAFLRFKYRKEQHLLTNEYIAQQEKYTSALKSEIDYYRRKNEMLAAEICELKERFSREIGELRGQLAAMARIMSGHCRYYDSKDDTMDPGCIYCTHSAAWGRTPETEGEGQ